MSFVAKEAYDDLQRRYLGCADLLYRIIANYRRSDEDARGVSSMEYLIEKAEALVLRGNISDKPFDDTKHLERARVRIMNLEAERDELRRVVEAAQPHICSYLCPSTWRAADDEGQPHCELCHAMRAVIED